MNLIHVFILSVIEGATEFLPVSSTGHLILASNLLRLPQTEFLKSFEIFIQLGAIAAIASLYAKKLIAHPQLLKPIAAAFIPTALVGFILYPFIKGTLFESTTTTVVALFAGGVLLIIFEKLLQPAGKPTVKIEDIGLKNAVFIGLAQSLSVVPGVSRAAATIIGGLFTGLDRAAAVEFSFLLALPTMAAATGFDLYKTGLVFTTEEYFYLLTGFAISFLAAAVAVMVFRQFIKAHNFVSFGIYRILVALVLAILLF